jgi:tRNA U34 5-carboxymethylaminomethyl modifying GTPase MnmE/TrmE
MNGEPLDQVVLTFAAKPNSYTGEDLVEDLCARQSDRSLPNT